MSLSLASQHQDQAVLCMIIALLHSSNELLMSKDKLIEASGQQRWRQMLHIHPSPEKMVKNDQKSSEMVKNARNSLKSSQIT